MNVPFPIIDAHAHLWLRQNAIVEGQEIKTLDNGKSLFMGEIRQMLPPFIIDGSNSAEIFLSNMDYAQVSAAIITQEYIDGFQNEYLKEVQKRYPDRFLCCGMVEARQPGYLEQARSLIESGFKGIKVPAQRLISSECNTSLTDNEMMAMFKLMEEKDIFLSIDLADGTKQVAPMKEVICECPDLRIAIGHFGMVTREGWQEQIKLAESANVRIESGGITWLFNEEFYPYKGAVEAIREAISLVGIEKLMWGSDYPRTIADITYRMSYDFVLKSPDLSQEEKAAFLGGNAIQFYRLKNIPTLPYIKSMVV
ncbi:MAG: amidohydrolase family protein [Bacteroidales bacterium]